MSGVGEELVFHQSCRRDRLEDALGGEGNRPGAVSGEFFVSKVAMLRLFRPVEVRHTVRMITLAIRLAIDGLVGTFVVIDKDMALRENTDSL